MKYSFPATFEEDEEDKGYFNVTFPDLLGSYTFGKGMDEARKMAKDLLESRLNFDYNRATTPSTVEFVKQRFPNCIVELVEVEYNG